MENKEFEKASVFRYKESVQYQEHAIVSKTVLKKETGNVSLFAFDKGEALSEHSAPFDAMVMVVEGKGQVIIDGKPNDIMEGETIIMPANIPHAVKAIERFKMVLTMIKSK